MKNATTVWSEVRCLVPVTCSLSAGRGPGRDGSEHHVERAPGGGAEHPPRPAEVAGHGPGEAPLAVDDRSPPDALGHDLGPRAGLGQGHVRAQTVRGRAQRVNAGDRAGGPRQRHARRGRIALELSRKRPAADRPEQKPIDDVGVDRGLRVADAVGGAGQPAVLERELAAQRALGVRQRDELARLDHESLGAQARGARGDVVASRDRRLGVLAAPGHDHPDDDRGRHQDEDHVINRHARRRRGRRLILAGSDSRFAYDRGRHYPMRAAPAVGLRPGSGRSEPGRRPTGSERVRQSGFGDSRR